MAYKKFCSLHLKCHSNLFERFTKKFSVGGSEFFSGQKKKGK